MILLANLFLLLSPLVSLCAGFSNYLLQSPAQRVAISSLFAEDTKLSPRAALLPEKERDVSYGEWIRQFRRTVYNHDDWIEHRGSDRFFSNLFNIYLSGVVREILKEVFYVATIATAVVVWNGIVVPNNSVALPVLSLPATPFTLSSPALGLLLVFRTNASYQRWFEARSMWGMIITQSRNLVRMASTWTTDCTTPAGLAGLDRLVQVTWACSRSLCNKLSGQVDDKVYEQELRQMFKQDDPTDFVNRLLKAPDKCHAALMELSLVLDNLPDIDLMKRVEIDKSLVHIGNCIGACERIFSAPVPLVYTRHTARFLSVWLLLLPLAMYDEFTTGWELIPASAMISIFLFGIEELAVQLEEPFSILPMQRFCDSILQTCSGFRDWTVERKRIIIKTLE